MAAKKQSEELRQAIRLLKLLSEAKQEAVMHLIRVMAEDEDGDLCADRSAVAEDLAEFERFHAGERSGLVSSEQVLSSARARRRGTTSSVPSLV